MSRHLINKFFLGLTLFTAAQLLYSGAQRWPTTINRLKERRVPGTTALTATTT